MIEERCMKLFLTSIKTKSTEVNYLSCMRYFKEFGKFKKYQDILKLKPKKLTEVIEDYIMFRREKNNPNSIGYYYYPIQAFLEMNDVLINFKKLKKMFPAKIKTVVERGWTTEEIQKMLDRCSNTKQRAIIHFENASGGRVGIFNGLKMKHLIPINDDIGKCYAIVGYANEIEEYITFLTPEATKALDNYFNKRRSDNEILNEDSPVFRASYNLGEEKTFAANSKTISSIPRYLQKTAGLRDVNTKKWNRYPVAANHGFRHRFDEVLKSVTGINVHLAEKMFAHTSRIVPMDGTYNTPKLENSFDEYKKIIHLLTISPNEHQRIELKQKQKEIDKLKIKTQEIEDLKAKISMIERELRIKEKYPMS